MLIMDLMKKGGIRLSDVQVGGRGKCTKYGLLGKCPGCRYSHVVCKVADERQVVIAKNMEKAMAAMKLGNLAPLCQGTPVLMPGGPGPSPFQQPETWMDRFGSKLTVHHTQGYRDFNQAVPTKDILQPKKGSVLGVYFSMDWCQPCVKFTLVLVAFAKTQSTDFTRILVSGCWSAEETKQYFAKMPWPHWAAME
jgi:hypothetical protein